MILAVVLVLLVALIYLSQTSTISIKQARQDTLAKNAVSDLGAAAKEVYAQGFGAKKKVYVSIPSGVDLNKTYVSNRSIRYSVAGNDYVSTQDFDLRGTLPTQEGGYSVWVVSEGNKVRIGYAMVLLDKQTLLVTMQPNQTRSETFRITNVWGSPINVSLSDKWNHERVSFSLDDYFEELPADDSAKFSAFFDTSDKAIGIYVSEINIIANDEEGNTEYVRLPIVLQVVPDPNKRPPLIVIPSIFNATINRSESASRSFQVCTNEVTSLPGVDFTPSPDEPGEWAGGLGSLGELGYDSCTNKVISVSVPVDGLGGNNTGYIRVNGEGNPEANDSIALLIKVAGGNDNSCPPVYNISTGVRRVHQFEDTTFFAVADDSLSGVSKIRNCEIRVDDLVPQQMFPTDGVFDNETEDVHYTYYGGFDMGFHNVSITCTDWPGNTGSECTGEYNFTIGKHILFVVSSGNETDWSNWIGAHSSAANYSWDYDIASFDELRDGVVNMYFYDTVVFLEWTNDDDILDLVLDYHNDGGFVGLFGPSAHIAVRDLAVEWHPDNPHVETHLNIMNISHYVLQDFVGTYDNGDLLEISPVYTKTYMIWGGNATNQIGASGWFFPDTKRLMLAEVNRTLFWGVEDPWRLNENGVKISTRVFDWMINQSLVE